MTKTSTTRRAYAFFHRYGSATSRGFQNDGAAYVFESKADRDAYIEKHGDRNITLRPCTRKEALLYATRDGNLDLVLQMPDEVEDGFGGSFSTTYEVRV